MKRLFFVFAFSPIYAMELMENEKLCKFPNYFSRIEEGKSQNFLNEEVSYIINNLKIPYAENGVLQHDSNFFTKLTKVIQSCCPEAKIYITGSTLRSILGYVYKKLHNAATKKPEKDLWCYTSERIRTHKDQTKKDGNLDPLKILNIGGAWEIAIDFPLDTNEDVKEKTKSEALKFSHGLASLLNLDFYPKLKSRKDVFEPVFKIEEYSPKSEEECEGLSLNQLAFSVSDDTFREPKDKNILENFLEGYADYKKGPASDRAECIVPGFAVLLEIPFLHYRKETAELLSNSLKELQISEDDKKELKKLKLNARFQGACNRFKENHDPEDEMILLNIKKLNMPTFLQKGKVERTNEVKDFYHGTPTILNAVSMYRNGFIMSDGSDETVNQEGDGFYATNNSPEAEYYATTNGHVVPIKICSSDGFRLCSAGINTHALMINEAAINKKYILESIEEERKLFFEQALSSSHFFECNESNKIKKLIDAEVMDVQEVNLKIQEIIQQLSEEEVDLIIKMHQEKLIPAVYEKGYYCHLIEDLLGFKGLSGGLVDKIKILNEKKIIYVQEWAWGTQPFALLKPIDQLDENKIEILGKFIDNTLFSTVRVSDFEYFPFLTAEKLERAKKNIETLKKSHALCSDSISINCINDFAKFSEKDVAQMAKEYEKKEKYPYEFFQNDQ